MSPQLMSTIAKWNEERKRLLALNDPSFRMRGVSLYIDMWGDGSPEHEARMDKLLKRYNGLERTLTKLDPTMFTYGKPPCSEQ